MPALPAHVDLGCPVCGYALKGLTTAICPECGVACTPAMLNHARRRAKRVRWSLTMLVIAFIMYAPHGWLLFIDEPWNAQRWLWIRLWPILPGLPATILGRSAWRWPEAEFVAMGLFTVAAMLMLTWIASRSRIALILVIILLTPASIYLGLISHALFQL